jgi:outer membrane protein assembly factor BamB
MSRRSLLQALAAHALPRAAFGQARAHTTPKPLSKDAVTHDWPSFLGPSHNAVSTETRLSRALPPPLVWEFPKGTGYASPAIAGDRLVFVHRLANEEIVECLHAETGASHWQFRYETAFEDRYGYNNGPRSSPVIDPLGGRVYTMGAEGALHCLDLRSGKIVWKRDLRTEYKVTQDFFGTASTPLLEGRLLIVNVGAPGGPSVTGFDKTTGREIWRAGRRWGPSYASPVPAVVHGKRRVFVFAGGESEPPTGGLLSIDPRFGRVDFAFPWRSRSHESVNASCPVVFGNKVFVSASYRTGSALVEVRPDFTHRVLWTTQEFGLHFNTAIYRGGYLYGFDGRNEPDASLACVDASNGRVVWREIPEWMETLDSSDGSRPQLVGT